MGQAQATNPGRTAIRPTRRPRGGALLRVLLCCCIGANAASARGAATADTTGDSLSNAARRQIERGVGQLLVPATRYRKGYPQHYSEQCSATLVSNSPRRDSRLLLSAWHCVEHYRDLSRSLVFVTGDKQRHPVTIVASGGSMDSDWVLLRLRDPLPSPMPLAGSTSGAPDRVVLAGFPRSGAAGRELVLRTACGITGRDGSDLRSDCVLSRGASGGAAIAATPAQAPRYLGVISRGDGESQSIFVPVQRFYRRIQPHLDAPASPAAPRP